MFIFSNVGYFSSTDIHSQSYANFRSKFLVYEVCLPYLKEKKTKSYYKRTVSKHTFCFCFSERAGGRKRENLFLFKFS